MDARTISDYFLANNLRRLALSLTAGFLTFVVLVTLTFATSNNWMHDGADNPIGRTFEIFWAWSLLIFSPFDRLGWHVSGLPAVLVIVGAPVLVYTAIYFALFRLLARVRAPRRA